MSSLTADIKKTVDTTKKVGRTTARVGRWTSRHAQELLPLLTPAATGAFVAAGYVAELVFSTPWAWVGTWAVGVGLVVFADGQLIAPIPAVRRRPAMAMLWYAIISAVAMTTVDVQLTTGFMLLVGIALGLWWWSSEAFRAPRREALLRTRMRDVLTQLGVSSETRVTSASTSANGNIEWRARLGGRDRPENIKARDVAHHLCVPTSSVIVRPVDSDDTRYVKITQLSKSGRQVARYDHPALRPGALDPGGAWAPGSRTIYDPAPMAIAMDDPDRTIGFDLLTKAGGRHKLIAGGTGGGKSVAVANLLVHVAASKDAVAGGVDLMKGGASFLPFAENNAMASLIHVPAEHATDDAKLLEAGQLFLDEAKWMLREIQRRTAAMASKQVTGPDGERVVNWPATEADPAIVWIIEEYATTISRLTSLDEQLGPQIEETINEAGKLARSSGITIVIVTQRITGEEMPAVLRSQMSQTALHKVRTRGDRGQLWESYDIDLKALSAGNGRAFIDLDGEDPILCQGFDLSEPADQEKLARAYSGVGPVFDWAGRGTAQPQETAIAADSGEDGPDRLVSLLADEDAQIPADAAIVSGEAEVAEGDDERAQAILAALEAADGGELTRAQIQAKTDLKATAVKILLQRLIDAGRVRRVGESRSTRYVLAA